MNALEANNTAYSVIMLVFHSSLGAFVREYTTLLETIEKNTQTNFDQSISKYCIIVLKRHLINTLICTHLTSFTTLAWLRPYNIKWVQSTLPSKKGIYGVSVKLTDLKNINMDIVHI